METKHTRTLEIRKDGKESLCHVYDTTALRHDGQGNVVEFVAYVGTFPTDAAANDYIRACNSHDALVEAALKARFVLSHMEPNIAIKMALAALGNSLSLAKGES